MPKYKKRKFEKCKFFPKTILDMLKVSNSRGITEVIFLTNDLVEILPKDKSNVIIIADSFFKKILEKITTNVFYLEPTESSKEIAEVIKLLSKILKNYEELPKEIYSIGGGIIQDISGFIASMIKRGIKWTFIPTTMASQCDSCIGSKISLNLGGMKNQLGLFYAPEKVIILPNLLNSLPLREYWAGFGEIMHYFLQKTNESDINLAREYSETLIKNLKPNNYLLTQVLNRSLKIKKTFIEADEFDQLDRKALNFGHTIAHALEHSTENKIPHGIAVLIGIKIIINFSENINQYKTGAEIHSILNKSLKFSYKYWDYDVDQKKLKAALLRDKKNIKNGFIRIICPSEANSLSRKLTDMRFMDIKVDQLVEFIIKEFVNLKKRVE
tara:strand:- start:1857 stop:3008 length:1152 start_codon:yes stop_codon:yes gene_type:complete